MGQMEQETPRSSAVRPRVRRGHQRAVSPQRNSSDSDSSSRYSSRFAAGVACGREESGEVGLPRKYWRALVFLMVMAVVETSVIFWQVIHAH